MDVPQSTQIFYKAQEKNTCDEHIGRSANITKFSLQLYQETNLSIGVLTCQDFTTTASQNTSLWTLMLVL